jgi:hypothetical protein
MTAEAASVHRLPLYALRFEFGSTFLGYPLIIQISYSLTSSSSSSSSTLHFADSAALFFLFLARWSTLLLSVARARLVLVLQFLDFLFKLGFIVES